MLLSTNHCYKHNEFARAGREYNIPRASIRLKLSTVNFGARIKVASKVILAIGYINISYVFV